MISNPSLSCTRSTVYIQWRDKVGIDCVFRDFWLNLSFSLYIASETFPPTLAAAPSSKTKDLLRNCFMTTAKLFTKAFCIYERM